MKKILAAILLSLTLGVSSAASAELGFRFAYSPDTAHSYTVYADQSEFCWINEVDAIPQEDVVREDGLTEYVIFCNDALNYGMHEFYMTATVNGVESGPSQTVEWDKKPVSSELLMPVIINMFRDVVD